MFSIYIVNIVNGILGLAELPLFSSLCFLCVSFALLLLCSLLGSFQAPVAEASVALLVDSKV